MDMPLLTSMIVKHAAVWHGDVEIVTHRVEGDMHRYTYADAYKRTCRLANALKRLGIRPGDRVGTMAWTTYRHLELYYAIGGSGSTYIYGLCDAFYRPKMTKDQCQEFVKKALAHAMARDGSSGGLIRTVKIDASGTERKMVPGNKLPFGPL
mgnify:CR=1 FL=1